MTIASRNRLIKSGMVFSCLLSVASIAAFAIIFSDPGAQNSFGEKRFLQFPDFFLLNADFLASTAAILALTILGTLTGFRMFFLFEKTPALEITFFSAGSMAMSVESIRLLVPLCHLAENKMFLISVISHFIFFVRLFFILTVVAGAVFSFEKKLQQTGTTIFALLFIAFLSGRFLPVNYSEPTTLFVLSPGYLLLVVFICVFLCATAALSFIIQGLMKGDAGYLRTAAGTFFMFAGWTLLCLCDNWSFLAAGILFQVLGTETYLRTLHASYLWQ